MAAPQRSIRVTTSWRQCYFKACYNHNSGCNEAMKLQSWGSPSKPSRFKDFGAEILEHVVGRRRGGFEAPP